MYETHDALTELYESYSEARRSSRILKDPDAYLASITADSVGPLPLRVRTVLTYMFNIEDAVWGVYFRELIQAPTGQNPVIGMFLNDWRADESVHARILEKIITESGGMVPGTLLRPRDMSWIARIFGERLFGSVHMTLGAINELMTRYAYWRFSDMTAHDHPRLAQVLWDIGSDESLHYSFYRSAAKHYLEASWLSQKLTLAVCRFAARGVGIGVRPAREAHVVFRVLLSGYKEEFLRKAQDPIRRLPGMRSFSEMRRVVDRAFAATPLDNI